MDLTNTEILQETHYYSFGMAMEDSWMDILNNPENKYLYNGKELNTDFDLNWSDYGARYYDAAIGRWNAVDPLADDGSQISFTPYHYVLNNPVGLIDPNGMIWADPKEAKALEGNIQNRITELNASKTTLENQLGNENISEEDRLGIENQIADIGESLTQLSTSLNDIDVIRNAEETFDLVPSSGDIHRVKQGKNGTINIEASSDGLAVHEIRHASLALQSKDGLQFSKSGNLKPALHSSGHKDEIQGYSAQYAMDPLSLPLKANKIFDIGIDWIGNINDTKGKLVYPKINELANKAYESRKKNKKAKRKKN